MLWTKDVFDWRSPADKKEAIEKVYAIIGPADAEIARRVSDFIENLKTPFRVTGLGLSKQRPAVFRIVDADGDEYDCMNGMNPKPFLITHHLRPYFKKTAAVLEEREEVPEVAPDAAELWSLLNMMIAEDARLIMRGVPVKSVATLLKDLRRMREQILKDLDSGIKTREKSIDTHNAEIEKLAQRRKKYECL